MENGLFLIEQPQWVEGVGFTLFNDEGDAIPWRTDASHPNGFAELGLGNWWVLATYGTELAICWLFSGEDNGHLLYMLLSQTMSHDESHQALDQWVVPTWL